MDLVAGTVYALCTLTAFACAWLLLRGYRASGTRLLLWGGLSFLSLTVNNALVFVDILVVPTVAPRSDLFLWRNIAAAAGFGVLVFGLVWDTD